jgi:hypothetical protein
MAPKTQLQLASLLTALREKLKLTPEQVGSRIGLKGDDVSQYETLEGGWWGEFMEVGLFDRKRLRELAKVLRVKKPVPFVRAIEVLLSPFLLEPGSRQGLGNAVKNPSDS